MDCTTWYDMFLRYFEISIEANKQIDAASRLEKHGRERVWDALDAGDDDQRIYAWRDRGASAPEACVKSIDLLLLRDVQTCSNYLSQVYMEMEKLTEFHTPSRGCCALYEAVLCQAFRKHWSSACIKTLGANHRALPKPQCSRGLHICPVSPQMFIQAIHRNRSTCRNMQ